METDRVKPSIREPVSTPAEPTVNIHFVTYLCYVGMVLVSIGVNHFPIILTLVMRDFVLTATEAGQASGIIFIGTITGSF